MPVNYAPKWADGLEFVWPPLNFSGEIPDIAVWDLEHQPTTFDFLVFLLYVRTLKRNHVRFCNLEKIADWKYSKQTAIKRFENILLQSCDLLGVEYSVGERVNGFTCGHHYGHINKFYKRYGVEKFPLTDSYQGHVTVTIRESIRGKARDSDGKEWDKLIQWLEKKEKVIVLEDREENPIPVAERMKLYSGAKMNLSVSNGPMSLCHFSESPYLMFKMIPEGPDGVEIKNHLIRGGFPPGSQLAFRNARQELIYQTDKFETMQKVYERFS